ncbi:MAG: hypothetical protein ABFD90_11750 [Phycisphaerales bacterium]
MNKRELLITGGVIVLGLLMAFPLTWLFRPGTSPGRSTGYGRAIHQTDANGADWAITPMAGRSTTAAGRDTQAKPSLIVKTDVFDRGNRDVMIGLVLEDRDGRRYQPVVSRNGVRQPVPTLRVVDEAGKVVLDGSFQYG